jgi:tRNA pseudouridine55 synthase
MVRIVKRALGISQVGHLGTLDPFASGLLPILVGGATRLSDSVMDGKKAYSFSVQLGVETDTLDLLGKVVCEAAIPDDFVEKLPLVVDSFLGRIDQVPPVYSAIKMDGKSLYDHMRSHGALPRDIESKVRQVDIFELTLLGVRRSDSGVFADFRVLCGKGTYVRSLARDIAKALGTCGHCSALRREYVEPWNVSEALAVEALEGEALAKAVRSFLRPAFELVPDYPVAEVSGMVAEKALLVGNGFVAEPGHISWVRTKGNSLSEVFWGFVQNSAGVAFLAEFSSTSRGYSIQPRKKL